MRYRLQRHDGTDCSATMVPITVLRMVPIQRYRQQIQKAGYIPVATFILPENCWTEHYYVPQAKAKEMFIKKYAGNKTAEKLMASICHEAELYSKYKEYYGYAFFIAKKINPFQG